LQDHLQLFCSTSFSPFTFLGEEVGGVLYHLCMGQGRSHHCTGGEEELRQDGKARTGLT